MRRERNGARFMRDGHNCVPSEQYSCTLGSKQPSTLATLAKSKQSKAFLSKKQDLTVLKQDLKHKYGDFDLPIEHLFFANLDWDVPDVGCLLTHK
jgi:hypothetical protein